MKMEIIVTIVSLCASMSSIIFALVAFKKSERQEHKKEGKNKGIILSDIGYIKACVDRVEKNLNKVDERYQDVVERLAKVEEATSNMKRQVDTLCINGGG